MKKIKLTKDEKIKLLEAIKDGEIEEELINEIAKKAIIFRGFDFLPYTPEADNAEVPE